MRIYGVVSLYCGLGGNARGLLQARSRLGSRFESVGAFDLDAEACEDYGRLTGAVAQRVDLGVITPAQLAARCQRRPDLVFLSAPCKAFSGCLPEKRASEAHYQRLNELAKRGVRLALEAWSQPPALILFENVPRIRTRGRELLEEIVEMLRERGYLVDTRVHDCGELGGLAQRRERYLLVARQPELAPTPLLRPPAQRVKSIAEVLWPLPVPVPGPSRAGAMHRLPKLSALNWLRLACIRAGRDWRDLPAVVAMPDSESRHSGIYGVGDAEAPSHTVIGQARAGKGWAAVDDPRLSPRAGRHNGGFGVEDGTGVARAILGEATVRNTPSSVADPRLDCTPRAGTMGVASDDSATPTVLGRAAIHNGVAALVDPRVLEQFRGAYGVQDPGAPAACVRGSHACRTAPAAVADGRGFEPTHRLWCDATLDAPRAVWTAGTFVLEGASLALDRKGRPCHVIIGAPDGTVHRPLTTLELAVLQGFSARYRPGTPDDLDPHDESGEWLGLSGRSSTRWRERIGNAVPPPAAKAMGEEVLEVLDAGAEHCFRLSSAGIWVEGVGERHEHRRLVQETGDAPLVGSPSAVVGRELGGWT